MPRRIISEVEKRRLGRLTNIRIEDRSSLLGIRAWSGPGSANWSRRRCPARRRRARRPHGRKPSSSLSTAEVCRRMGFGGRGGAVDGETRGYVVVESSVARSAPNGLSRGASRHEPAVFPSCLCNRAVVVFWNGSARHGFFPGQTPPRTQP